MNALILSLWPNHKKILDRINKQVINILNALAFDGYPLNGSHWYAMLTKHPISVRMALSSECAFDAFNKSSLREGDSLWRAAHLSWSFAVGTSYESRLILLDHSDDSTL